MSKGYTVDENNKQPITTLLHKARNGDPDAFNELSPYIYSELKKIAKRAFNNESACHTLQPTALVNEAFEKLVSADINWQDRQHFYVLSARMMRRVLVDHAKSKSAVKRGGGLPHFSLDESLLAQPDANLQLLALEEALEKLEKYDVRKVQVIELFYFGGLSVEEIAPYINVSKATIRRDLKLAQAWLKDLLES
ncbi:ECF-type sigma factor [Aliikangiella sp. IMCC44359]|uniref:ECF-type sigma factor n=1 Tax=Aliikangiella sp. IMCC44359 TaxID=3459125 RepID=UPI00403AE9DC